MTTDGYNTMDNASITMVRIVQARYEQQKALADRRGELLRDALEVLEEPMTVQHAELRKAIREELADEDSEGGILNDS